MAAIGVTSPPAAVAAAVSSASHHRRSGLPIYRFAATSLLARCAAADAPAAAGEEEAADSAAGTDVASRAFTATRPPYSLISSENVQKALRGLAITDADHYGRLGINKLASTDEVQAAYEQRCAELNSKGLEEEELNKELVLLKESFAILSTEEERRLYDWSLARSVMPERYVWPYQVDAMEKAPDPPKEQEDELPTKLVGYFFLAWFILSVALSVTLNR